MSKSKLLNKINLNKKIFKKKFFFFMQRVYKKCTDLYIPCKNFFYFEKKIIVMRYDILLLNS